MPDKILIRSTLCRAYLGLTSSFLKTLSHGRVVAQGVSRSLLG